MVTRSSLPCAVRGSPCAVKAGGCYVARRLAGAFVGPRTAHCALRTRLPQVTGERLALVDADVRLTDDGRQVVGDRALGQADVAEVPGHTDDMDHPVAQLEGPHPGGD